MPFIINEKGGQIFKKKAGNYADCFVSKATQLS